MADFERFKQKYDWWGISRIHTELTGLINTGGDDNNSPKLRELYANVEEMLETRDKIIRECLDKEKLEKARSRLALSKTLHSRLGENTPLDIDVIDKINTNLIGRGKHSKKLNRKKRNKSKKKSK
jgi:hypothetical protein